MEADFSAPLDIKLDSLEKNTNWSSSTTSSLTSNVSTSTLHAF